MTKKTAFSTFCRKSDVWGNFLAARRASDSLEQILGHLRLESGRSLSAHTTLSQDLDDPPAEFRVCSHL